MIEAWIFNSLMSWGVTGIVTLLVWISYCVATVHLKVPRHFKWYWWVLGLVLTLFINFMSPSNRPKNDVTMNQYQQQSQYEQQVEKKASSPVKIVIPVEDTFEDRKENTKKLFEY